MNQNRLWLCAGLLVVTACASGPKVVDDQDPWQVDKDHFKRNADVIAVADIYLPGGMPEPEVIKKKFSDLIDMYLVKSGYTVVRPQRQYGASWARAVDDVGGIQDTTVIGQSPKKIARAMERVLEEEEGRYDVDAVLVPSIVVVEAKFARGAAAWDGVKQSIKTGGAMENFFAGSPDGTLGALSLTITVVSPRGNPQYQRSGGIEVLSKLKGKEFVLVPRSELFTDVKRIEKSVKIALDPLLD